jgi:UDP-galactopyranose mutase
MYDNVLAPHLRDGASLTEAQNEEEGARK